MQAPKQRPQKNTLTGLLSLAHAQPALWYNPGYCQGMAPPTAGRALPYQSTTKKTTPHRYSHRWTWSGQSSVETLSSQVTLCCVTLSVSANQDKSRWSYVPFALRVTRGPQCIIQVWGKDTQGQLYLVHAWVPVGHEKVTLCSFSLLC